MPAESTSPRGRSLGLLAVLGATAFWSFGGVLGKATGVGGVVLSFWRMWVATAVLLLIALVLKRWPSRTDFRRAAPLGVLFGLNICTFFTALQYVSVAVALIIGALTPVVALPIAVVLMGERLTTVKVVCAVTAVSGVVVAVLAAPTDDEQAANLAVGYVWAVVSLLIWVAYLLLAKRAREGIETFRFMVVMSLVGAVTVSMIMPFVDQPIDSLDRSGWVWVVLLSLGPGIAGHGLLTWAHPRVDASVSSLLIQAEPVGATIAAWVFLGEKVSLVQGVAMGVVLVALGVLAWREARDVGLALDEAIA